MQNIEGGSTDSSVPEQSTPNKDAPIVDQNTPEESAETESLSLLDADGKEVEIEKIRGGYFDEIQPLIVKHPDIFRVRTDSEGRTVIISDFIDTVLEEAVNTRAVIVWQNQLARITGQKPLLEEEKQDLLSISPETLKDWHDTILNSDMLSKAYQLKPGSLEVNKLTKTHYTNMTLQQLHGKNFFENFIKPPIEALIENGNATKSIEE